MATSSFRVFVPELSDDPIYRMNGVRMTEEEFDYYLEQNEIPDEVLFWDRGPDGFYCVVVDDEGKKLLLYRSFTYDDLKAGSAPMRIH
jgi:hypothetical protein